MSIVERPFPHAFERWETLSSRWEGIAAFWIARLEENRRELQEEKLEVQLRRQILDLSSAGANLFHAVVELQRLRAQSERKFQRWYIEVRSQQDRSRELTAELERTLREEREKRAHIHALRKTTDNRQVSLVAEVEELRREITISREECRRAWEELGKKESESRRILDGLKAGETTLIGGVEVFPVRFADEKSGV